MKIEYDLKDDWFKYLDKANGIYLKRKKLKKNPSAKIRGYLSSLTIGAIKLILLLVLIAGIADESVTIITLMIELVSITVGVYTFLATFYLFQLWIMNRKNRGGVLEINKEGILDRMAIGIQLGLTYEQIDLIVLTDEYIVFLAKEPVCIVINNKEIDIEKFINKMKRMGDFTIINRTTE